MEKSARAEHEVVATPAPEVEEDGVMMPGFRFHPTDEELIGFYLRRKVEKKPLSIEIIKEMDVYKHEPWDLPKFMITAGEKEWYFFCRRGRKYRNSVRPNRVTGCGFWKATGVDRPIQSAAHHFIGLKKSLVFYRGHAGKGTKTDWMMHEFRLPDSAASSATVSKNAATMKEAEVWTICRIFKRSTSYKKQPSTPNSYKTSITTPTKSPPESSSVTNCGDPDDYVCCTSSAGGSPADQLQLLHRHHHLNHTHPHKVHATANLVDAGAWTSMISNNKGGGQALLLANSSSALVTMNEQISPSSNDFMRDSIWDELGRISEFLADDVGFPSNDSGCASYALEIDNVI